MSDAINIGGKELVAELGHWDYDWTVFGVFRDYAGRLYTASDSGCSCNSPWEDHNYIDFNPVPSVQAAIERARKFVDVESYANIREGEYEAFVKQVLEVR